MFGYYLERGHSIKELESLTYLEKAFLTASMELHIEAEQNAIEEMKEKSK